MRASSHILLRSSPGSFAKCELSMASCHWCRIVRVGGGVDSFELRGWLLIVEGPSSRELIVMVRFKVLRRKMRSGISLL